LDDLKTQNQTCLSMANTIKKITICGNFANLDVEFEKHYNEIYDMSEKLYNLTSNINLNKM